APAMSALVDVVVVDERGVVQQLDGRRQLGGSERIAAGTDPGRELDELWPQPFATGLDQAPHRRGDGFGIDHELPRQLELDERLERDLLIAPDELAVQLQRDLPLTRTVELDREHRLPATQDKVAFLDHERCERAQQELAAVS